ncbi:MAG: hypothetical protein QXU95_04305 [Candidatus Bathyarchaeia archaeon]
MIRARLPEGLFLLLESASFVFAKGKSQIIREALVEYFEKHKAEFIPSLREKMMLLKSFAKSEPNEAKVISIASLYRLPKEVAEAYVKADAFIDKLNIKEDDYVVRESWWLLAARYYQSDPKAAEVIEKSLELGDKEDLGNILFLLYRKPWIYFEEGKE